MNYFETVNKCLTELGYKQVNTFSELVKNDHKRIKNIINIINIEVCDSDNWNFKLRKTEFTLDKGISEVNNPISGKIASIVIDGHIYKYYDRPELYIMGEAPQTTYSIFNDKLMLPMFKEDTKVNVIYYTSASCRDISGNDKDLLEKESDESLIPEIYSEPILVYGTCMRLKGNPQHVKFSYWLSMYNKALANLKSGISTNAEYSPTVKLFRI